MRSWATALGLLLGGAAVARAAEVILHADDENRQRCSGMYSRKAWGGNVDPYILIDFVKPTDENELKADPIVSLVIFEWNDAQYIGADSGEDEDRLFICDDQTAKANFCNATNIGEFILSPKANSSAMNLIISEAIHLNNSKPVNYPIKKTGYFCVGTYGYKADEYTAVVEFRNAYGELPASQIAKLPFYGGIAIVYAVLGCFWGFLYFQHRSDILPVQNYITAILIFLIVEMLMTWGFYDYMNAHGSNALAKVFMIIVAVLNAGRNSFSFFLLLIVCMGYGVVKPSLGKLMWYCRALALGHFVFGVIYAVASLAIVSPETAGPLVLFVILPLAATLTGFYVWTLNSLNLTMKELLDRKQNVKAMMYKRLWWVLLGSILVIFAFFFLNSLTFAGHGSPDFVPSHWQTRWFILDGWLNLVYLVDLAVIAYLWRPTLNNRRFAMSDELAQDDDGFEIASIAGSDDDEELGHMGGTGAAPGGTHQPLRNRDTDSPPPAFEHRDSAEGEAIFSVGDDLDRWSDDASSTHSNEGSNLKKKD